MEYKNKEELLDELNKRAKLFINEFQEVQEEEKDIFVEGVDRTPVQIISYQLGWLRLVKSWDEDELSGKEVFMPTKEYKWNNLGGLYRDFYKQYEDYSLEELIEEFDFLIDMYNKWIGELSEKELFQQGYRKWTGDKPNWPMARWIHINSVAPFKTFRSRIRKWKRLKG